MVILLIELSNSLLRVTQMSRGGGVRCCVVTSATGNCQWCHPGYHSKVVEHILKLYPLI